VGVCSGDKDKARQSDSLFYHVNVLLILAPRDSQNTGVYVHFTDAAAYSSGPLYLPGEVFEF
jgi:hypothetical protein